MLRLGQRVIQHIDAPIILTGYQAPPTHGCVLGRGCGAQPETRHRVPQALNKLLGTNVYESNSQLGGPEVTTLISANGSRSPCHGSGNRAGR